MTRTLPLTRRVLLWLAASVLVGSLLAGCAPRPAAPTAAPPTAAPPAAQADGGQWERVAAAAKREGSVSVLGPAPDVLRNALLTFSKQYPDIKVEYSGGFARAFVPKVLAEREAGQYLWDVHIGGSGSAFSELAPQGAYDPLKAALILPAVLDDSKWRGGFDAGFQDKGKQFVYAFQGSVVPSVMVNRDILPVSELSKIEQLTDSKWKGKIVWDDPRTNGIGSTNASLLLAVLGKEFMQGLLQQDPVVTTDQRQLVDRLVRGSLPIGIGVDLQVLSSFQTQGLGKNIKPLDQDGPAGARVGSFWGNAMLMNNAPHPNAAKVFLNWLLSNEGQSEWVKAAEAASRRLDVPAPEGTLPGPRHRVIDDEANFTFQSEVTTMAKETIN